MRGHVPLSIPASSHACVLPPSVGSHGDYVLGRARERDPDRDCERQTQRPRQAGLEKTRAAGRDATVPLPLPDPDRGEQYRLFQRAWSGPGR